VNFNGRFHVLREASLLPPPERPIPILVAGNGPRLLRLVARYADVWNTAWFGLPNGRLRERLRNLDAALAAQARDPSSLRLTAAIEIVDPAAAPSEGVRRTSIGNPPMRSKRAVDSYEQLGIDGLTIGLRRTVDRLGDAVGRTLLTYFQFGPKVGVKSGSDGTRTHALPPQFAFEAAQTFADARVGECGRGRLHGQPGRGQATKRLIDGRQYVVPPADEPDVVRATVERLRRVAMPPGSSA
jgi:Luciferase-like monooxygenase